jgi:UDP-2-acetamido-2,6-beta-L-arabino-hexul-4-ose reductase
MSQKISNNGMRILITGSSGFIGSNLWIKLKELQGYDVATFTRDDSIDYLLDIIKTVDVIIHLAGENRPTNTEDFHLTNVDLTKLICDGIKISGKKIHLIFASSTQALLRNAYGISKFEAEQLLENFHKETGSPVTIYRFPGIFGKWSKPNYNSVVATFCHNIANNIPIQINDPSLQITLVYIDDVISDLILALNFKDHSFCRRAISPEYSITLSELASQISAFADSRITLISESVGNGLVRALYSTYISYLPASKFSYDLPEYKDERGVFVEMLKTKNAGQFSYFTAYPGVTRGGHYHHSKTEKFLVIKGQAKFCFRHILTNERYQIFTTGDLPKIVETIPGWAHDITNIGQDEMIVALWSNEILDKNKMDTIKFEVN